MMDYALRLLLHAKSYHALNKSKFKTRYSINDAKISRSISNIMLLIPIAADTDTFSITHVLAAPSNNDASFPPFTQALISHTLFYSAIKLLTPHVPTRITVLMILYVTLGMHTLLLPRFDTSLLRLRALLAYFSLLSIGPWFLRQKVLSTYHASSIDTI